MRVRKSGAGPGTCTGKGIHADVSLLLPGCGTDLAPGADTAACGLRRYQMYAQRQQWKVQLVSESGAERGGLKECILQVPLSRPEL